MQNHAAVPSTLQSLYNSLPAEQQSDFWAVEYATIHRRDLWHSAGRVFRVLMVFGISKDKSSAFPSVETIARLSGVKRRSVFYSLKKLGVLGLVNIARRPNPKSTKTTDRYLTSLYSSGPNLKALLDEYRGKAIPGVIQEAEAAIDAPASFDTEDAAPSIHPNQIAIENPKPVIEQVPIAIDPQKPIAVVTVKSTKPELTPEERRAQERAEKRADTARIRKIIEYFAPRAAWGDEWAKGHLARAKEELRRVEAELAAV